MKLLPKPKTGQSGNTTPHVGDYTWQIWRKSTYESTMNNELKYFWKVEEMRMQELRAIMPLSYDYLVHDVRTPLWKAPCLL